MKNQHAYADRHYTFWHPTYWELFGAMHPAIEAQARGDCFYFIADYHSMTSVFDALERRKNTLGIALDWLGCGLDPNRSVFWRQSDVHEVCELTWLIGSLTLMAADILLYDTHCVPVGKDQKQHIEMTRDMAIKFNETYGDTFVVPDAEIRSEVAVVPGLDGQKMSKSYDNTIEIFGDEKVLRKKVMSIVMDSRRPDVAKPDGIVTSLFNSSGWLPRWMSRSTSAITKNDPFVLRKSGQHREHGLARAKNGSWLVAASSTPKACR